jgi:hypothetical protein
MKTPCWVKKSKKCRYGRDGFERGQKHFSKCPAEYGLNLIARRSAAGKCRITLDPRVREDDKIEDLRRHACENPTRRCLRRNNDCDGHRPLSIVATCHLRYHRIAADFFERDYTETAWLEHVAPGIARGDSRSCQLQAPLIPEITAFLQLYRPP